MKTLFFFLSLMSDPTAADCLAKTVYFEARGEPVAGQMAVASVVLARVRSEGYPDSICKVVTDANKPGLHRCQFSWWCDGRSDQPKDAEEFKTSMGVALLSLLLFPQPERPTHFHSVDRDAPWDFEELATIGRHVFYADEGTVQAE